MTKNKVVCVCVEKKKNLSFIYTSFTLQNITLTIIFVKYTLKYQFLYIQT